MLQMPPSAARRLTGALLGAEGAWGDEMLDDAVGELCNMVAGRWKSSLGLAARCHLAAPAVSRGVARESLDLESLGRITMRRVYRFDDSAFELKLTVR